MITCFNGLLRGFSGGCLGVMAWCGTVTRVDAVLKDPVVVDPAALASAAQAMKGFKVEPGYEFRLWAAEPMLGNPVAFCIDEQGRVFVAETYRFEQGVSDNRQSGFWLDEDLAAQTVEDRLAYYEKYATKRKEGMAWYTNHVDQVRMLVDTNGDGTADSATVFSGPYNEPLDGLASGLIARDGDVYLTNIPHLWRLRDEDGDGVAEKREALLSGFGVRTAFLGHDMHGLVWGPDGLLYWSIGDRGYNVVSKEGKRFAKPNQGAVFRCNPDGTGLEVFHTGLRNPQELAFNHLGDLFTCDNNSDSGDRARVLYLPEGGDAGWTMEYQYQGGDYSRGPYNAEGAWHEPTPDNLYTRPAYVIPPLSNQIFSGPSGFVYTPGGLFGEKYRDSFFVADFRGGAGSSQIVNFSVSGAGAGYALGQHHAFIRNVLITDVDFGYDGNMYLSDWINGWKGPDKGRIHTVRPVARSPEQDALVAQTRTLFAEGFAGRETPALLALLGFDDMRVRLRAQYELARRAKESLSPLQALARASGPLIPRLHALWAIGQIQRSTPPSESAVIESLLDLMNDPDPEIPVQLARLMGEHRVMESVSLLEKLLAAGSPRQKASAAVALGKLGQNTSVPSLTTALAANNDKDLFLRQALAMGLYGAASPDMLVGMATHESQAVRLGAVLALRHSAHPGLAAFLNDSALHVATESARAIYDLPVPDAMPALAHALASYLKENPTTTNAHVPLLRRVLSANHTLGNVEALVAFAAQAGNPDVLRKQTIEWLIAWRRPSSRDPVNGQWRPIAPRSPDEVKKALEPQWARMLETSTPPMMIAVLGVVREFGESQDPALLAAVASWMGNDALSAEVRAAALKTLSRLQAPDIDKAINTALMPGTPPLLRAAALEMVPRLDKDRALSVAGHLLLHGENEERQQAVRTLTTLGTPDADTLLASYLGKIVAGEVSGAALLELRDAAEAGKLPRLTAAWKVAHEARAAKGAVEAHWWALEGGTVSRGHDVFKSHAAAQCLRCHIDGGGIGPDLKGIASTRDATYLLRSLLEPNVDLAPGYGMVSMTLKNGENVAGIQRDKNEREVRLIDPEGKERTVAVDLIASETPPFSAMPPVGLILTAQEIRDVMAYLNSLKK